MSVLYKVELDHPSDIASTGSRMRSLALRVGFSDLRASMLGMLIRDVASTLDRGGRIKIGLRAAAPPSRLTVTLEECQDADRAEAVVGEQADSISYLGADIELSFRLPDPEFSPEPSWLRDTQIQLAEETPEELQHELKRTNEDLRVVLEQLRRQARHEANKARALQNANTELEQKHAAEFRLARIDPVSKLPSRVQFEQSLADQIKQSRRKDKAFALLYIDIDYFKQINDDLGHAAGDQTLAIIGQRMASTLRDSDLVGRLGGDEFGAILGQLGHPSDAGKVAALLIAAIREPIALDAGTGRVDGSVGIAIFPDDGQDAGTLMENADRAMYSVKRNGRGNFAFYGESAGSPASAEASRNDPGGSSRTSPRR